MLGTPDQGRFVIHSVPESLYGGDNLIIKI